MQTRPILTFGVSALVAMAWIVRDPLSAQQERPSGSAVASTRTAFGEPTTPARTERTVDVPAVAADSQVADAYFLRARENLLGYRSIKARLVQVTAVGNRRFKATGTYLQGTNLKLRLDYEVEVSGNRGTLLQVCDGQVLWTRQTVGGSPKITRRDVRQILRAATNGPRGVERMLVAELGLGGLPALMASLDEHMAFETAREESIDGKSFTVVDGKWTPQFLDGWRQASPRSKELPLHVPDAVRIYLDDKNLFPRRILYLKRPEGRDALVPMVTLDFVDVVLNAPVSDDEFYFVPPDGVVQEDVTNQFLQRLKSIDGAD